MRRIHYVRVYYSLNMKWNRTYKLTSTFPTERKESWISENGYKCEMVIRYGKHTNLFGFKQNSVKDFNTQVERCRNLCHTYLKDENNLEHVTACPLCGLDGSGEKDISIHDMRYLRCPRCDFHYLEKRLNEKASDEFYKHDTTLSATLTDPKLTQARVREIVIPKVDWITETFKQIHGQLPEKVVDVGAGGGHFVFAARERGLDVVGIEPNKPSADYCKTTFNVELKQEDFLEYAKEHIDDTDIVTFWAVLEHIPSFMTFLKSARKMFNKRKGMIVVEVPRWNSFDSVLQERFPDSVNRHLFPVSHIQIFSDSSLANAFVENNFLPRAAWYFGMDMFELTMQLARKAESGTLINECGSILLELQPALDQAMLSDTMVFAGVPSDNLKIHHPPKK